MTGSVVFIRRTYQCSAVVHGVRIADHPVQANALVDDIIKENNGIVNLRAATHMHTWKQDGIAHRSINPATIIDQRIGQLALGAYLDRLPVGDIPVVFRHAAPAIGQHTDEIMRELGFSDAEIADYRAQNVIG